MSTFRHTPDDNIWINSTTFPLSFFLTQEPAYALPAGETSRYYDDSSVHYTSDGYTQKGQEFPWTDGDGYIANLATYVAAYAAATAPSLAEAKITAISTMENYANTSIASGYILHNGNQFFSSDVNSLIAEDLAYTRAGALPGTHYVNDVGYNQITMADLTEFEALIDRIVGLHFLTRLNEDVHRTAINALTTVSACQSYDYTTGWPITPYSEDITFYATYSASIDADYAGGTATGTATGGAAIASGVLDLAHSDVRYVSYTGTSNVDNQQIGTIRFKLTPNYSGAPSSDKVFVAISKANSDAINLIQLTHLAATSNIQVVIKDQAAANITSVSLASWTPVSGTEYEFCLYYDITSGKTFLKIDNVQLGSTQTDTGTRSASINLLRVGASYDSAAGITSNFTVSGLIVSSS